MSSVSHEIDITERKEKCIISARKPSISNASEGYYISSTDLIRACYLGRKLKYNIVRPLAT